ncbi:MAG: ATP-binding cassette domain-containing protein, partial [Atribacterota bacterium]|nr:ATP-binding cassette domain-containing protein [Atribacterota bacterium]
EIADRVTVMRKGKVVDTFSPASASPEKLAEMMVGKKVIPVAPRKSTTSRAVLELKGVWAIGDKDLPALLDVSLTVREGEIVGVAGVAGNGQKELAEVIVGLRRVRRGHILLDGRDITSLSPREIASLGVAYVPEERNIGLVGEM